MAGNSKSRSRSRGRNLKRGTSTVRTPARSHKRQRPSSGSGSKAMSISRSRSMFASRSRTRSRSKVLHAKLVNKILDHPVNEVVHGTFTRVHSRFSLGKGKPQKGCGSFKFYDQTYGTLSSPEGKQGVDNLISVAGLGDLVYGAGINLPYCCTNSAKYPYTAKAMFDLNPYQLITGSGYYTAGAGPSSDFIFLDYIKLVFDLANMSNTACILDIYVVQPKITGNNDPTLDWNAAIRAQGIAPDNADAVNANNVIGVYTAPTEGRPTPYMLGQKPLSIPAWSKQYKVIGVKSFDFAVDTNVIWSVDLHFNKRLDRQYLLQTKADTSNYANCTVANMSVQFMYVLRGPVVADTEIIASKNASIGNAQIGCCVTREYHCHAANPNRIESMSAVPFLLAGNSLAAETVETVVDGAAIISQLL